MPQLENFIENRGDGHTACRVCSNALGCLGTHLETVLREELEQGVRQGRVQERGQILFETGDRFRHIYAVRSGSVKVTSLSNDGEEQVLGFYLPGEMLGLEAIDRGVHTCTAMALETSSICEMDFAQLERLSSARPALLHRLNRIYSREIARDYAMLRLLGRRNAEQRLASFLLNLSQRFAERGYSADEFNLSMSRHDIGNYLGLALETVSRLLARFQNQGVLSVNRRHVRIVRHDALRLLAGETTLPRYLQIH